MTDEDVNAFAYKIENASRHASGIDNTVITYAAVYFIKRPLSHRAEPDGEARRGAGGEVETFKVAEPFTIVIADTGIAAPTRGSVGDVRKLWEADQKHWEKVFDEVADISFAARRVIEEGWINMLGELMDENHALLQEMTVSSAELDHLVESARKAGALGAKLSGGGRGGNMIALVNPEISEHVSSALKEAGAKNTIITQVS
jgi:mevalonate kinase